VSGAYPLERLAELRALRAAGAAIDLAAALRGEAAAEDEVRSARAAVEAARWAARGAALVGAPGPDDDRGEPAWQVARRAAWAVRLRRDVARAEARLADREAACAEWRQAVAQARDQATSARADNQVVERHRERWEDSERKRRERRED
jgi:hypothetical protein